MSALVITIAVVICAAYLLWQVWDADLVDDRKDAEADDSIPGATL